MVGAEDPAGVKGWTSVGVADGGCTTISTEDGGMVFVGGDG